MKKINRKSILITLCSVFLATFGLWQIGSKVFAEQFGSSPDSGEGSTSRIKAVYDSLDALSHGDESAGSWGDWGSMWNRIRSAGEWVPTGDATEADVATGKFFYKDSRTQLEGTASLAPDYSDQSLQDWDDMKNYNYGEFTPNGSGEDNTDEEATWTNTAGDATTGVWKDGRTGLYWSANQGYHNDLFTKASCAFFSTTPRGAYAGDDTDCGPIVVDGAVTVSAINVCGQLSLDANGDATPETDWYLPSQKELMQAYIDGIFNQTNATFTTYEYFRSSTEYSDPSEYAWNVYLPGGYTGYGNKNSEGVYAVRCVRRD